MIIDISTHILPRALERLPKLVQSLAGSSFEHLEIARHASLFPGLADVDKRRQAIAHLSAVGYRQILSVAHPPIEEFGRPSATAELYQAANEELAELVALHPDYFIGAFGAVPVDSHTAASEELDRVVALGLCGVQLFASYGDVALDDPRSLPVLEEALRRSLPVFIHPARTAATPDFGKELTSKLNLWLLLGWPYETAALMLRLAVGGLFDRHPDAVVISHHLGGVVPALAARIEYLLRTPGAAEALRRFAADTAVLGGDPQVIATGLGFFGSDRVMFGTDTPMDRRGGAHFVAATLATVEAACESAAVREAILAGNAMRLLRLTAAGESQVL